MNIPYKTIMVPLDGSDLSEKALEHAQMLATELDAELILFQAVPEVNIIFEVTDSGVPEAHSSQTTQESLVDDAARYLESHVNTLQRHKIDARSMVDVGDPADRIIENAKSEKVDALVMNTHGRTGLARWTYGSVAAKVLQEAPCPVLLIRATL